MLYLIVRTFPNPAHSSTFTEYDESEAYRTYNELEAELSGNDKYSVALILFDGHTAQVAEFAGDRDGAHQYAGTRLRESETLPAPVCDHSAQNLGYANRMIFCLDCDGVLADNSSYEDFEHMTGGDCRPPEVGSREFEKTLELVARSEWAKHPNNPNRVEDRICRNCGEQFAPATRGQDACSSECRVALRVFDTNQ